MTASAGAELTRLGDRVHALLDGGRDRRVPGVRAVLRTAGVGLLVVMALAATEPVAVKALSSHPQGPDDQALAGRIDHDPVGCFIEGTNPEIEARIEPVPARARVFFASGRSAGGAEHYVEMARDGDRWVGVLPRPQKKASPVRYRIEAHSRDGGALLGTDRYHVVVMKDETSCPAAARVAPQALSADSVTVFVTCSGPLEDETCGEPLPALPADPSLDGWIVHEAIDCLVEKRGADVAATFEPSSGVAEVRLYFSNEKTKDDVEYFTPMPRLADRYVGRLPPPLAEGSPVHYRIEARRTDGRLASTPRYQAVVIPDGLTCPASGRVAPQARSPDPVRVY